MKTLPFNLDPIQQRDFRQFLGIHGRTINELLEARLATLQREAGEIICAGAEPDRVSGLCAEHATEAAHVRYALDFFGLVFAAAAQAPE